MLQKLDRLDILVNNAGLLTYTPYQTTEDGIETHFGVNYLSMLQQIKKIYIFFKLVEIIFRPLLADKALAKFAQEIGSESHH